MSNAANRLEVPSGWMESLLRSKAQIAASETVPLLPVLERLRVNAEKLDAAAGIDGEEAGRAE